MEQTIPAEEQKSSALIIPERKNKSKDVKATWGDRDLPTLPTGYRVLVCQEPVEEVSEAGIIVSTTNEAERENTGHYIGVVMAVGPCAFNRKDQVNSEGMNFDWFKVGDRVMYARYSGKAFGTKGGTKDQDDMIWRLLNDVDIIAVCRPGEQITHIDG